MFDLEKAIKLWRKSLNKNASLEDGYKTELESHLSDEIQIHIQNGLNEEDAFHKAADSIGPLEAVGKEYRKSDSRQLARFEARFSNRFMQALVWNYMKIALRRIRKHKGYSFINVTGLAIGITCCILIFLWIQDEYSFDRFHEKFDDIYRVISERYSANKTSFNARSANPVGPTLKENYPEIINYARFQGFDGWLVKSDGKSFTNDNLGTADPSFFEIFTFPFIKGDPKTALKDRYSIVLTENMARKYFNDEDPIGKTVTIVDDFKVTGVIKNIPENSHLNFDCIFPIINMEGYWHEDFTKWTRIRFYTYLQLQKNVSPASINQKISGIINEHFPKANTKIFLQPFKDIHLRSNFDWDLDNYKQGYMTTIYVFSLTALCILLIACINFMNLTTARSVHRAKEVGMRKVTGAKRSDIIKQFFGETFMLTFIALMFSLLLTEILLPSFNRLTGKEIDLTLLENTGLLFGLLAITLVTSFLSGSYPALFLSRFHPVRIIRGISLFHAPRGAVLRKVLVVFQFTMTIILIIATTVIFSQLNYIYKRDLGFEKEHIIEFWTARADAEAFKNELLQNPNILSFTHSEAPNDELIGVTGFDWEGKNLEEDIMLFPVAVDHDYLDTFGIKLSQGRFFSREIETDAAEAVVINETAAQAMGLESPIGKKISFSNPYVQIEGRIIGVLKDFHFSSLRNEIEPIVFHVPEEFPHTCIKLSSKNIPGTIAYIESTWKKFVKEYPFTYEFIDEKINNFYQTEHKVAAVFRYFTLLAIFIASLGLFALAAYTAEQRTKEIGIRKVLGAPISTIILMLSKEFTKWVLAASIVACPAAYLLCRKWLMGFAYRINLGWEIFAFSVFSALAIAILTVSYQAIKTATANPVDSLRYE